VLAVLEQGTGFSSEIEASALDRTRRIPETHSLNRLPTFKPVIFAAPFGLRPVKRAVNMALANRSAMAGDEFLAVLIVHRCDQQPHYRHYFVVHC
jgi:hypothetical protein